MSKKVKFTILLLAILALLSGAFWPVIKPFAQPFLLEQASKWKIIPEDEHFTELYFTDPALLPKAAAPEKPVSFSWSIHNLEGREVAYKYIVYFIAEKENISEGTVVLENGEVKDIPVTHTFTLPKKIQKESGAIYVELPELNQSIHFFIQINKLTVK